MWLTSVARKVLSPAVRDAIVAKQRQFRLQKIRTGTVDFGDFKRVTPISSMFGFDRGQAIDRYYIEHFLKQNADCINGRCLEMGDPTYIGKFGDGVTQIDLSLIHI